MPGEYMKPHIRAAMTAGTAYGANSVSRKNRLPLRAGASSNSANSSASPSCSGTEMRKNSPTLRTLCQNSGSESAVRY